jgi:hypothetical protein
LARPRPDVTVVADIVVATFVFQAVSGSTAGAAGAGAVVVVAASVTGTALTFGVTVGAALAVAWPDEPQADRAMAPVARGTAR